MDSPEADKQLDALIDTLLEGLPAELKQAVRKKVEFYKTKQPAFYNKEIYLEAKELVRLEMLAYLDRRQYLAMYNRRWAEHKIFDGLIDIVSRGDFGDVDLFSLARVNFDLNGLKALNDLAGHEAGNKGLERFALMLKSGETTGWLRQERLEVTPTAEGGDEFGMILKADKDLRPLAPLIVERYSQEALTIPAADLINFSHPAVSEKLELLGIDKLPPDFKFKLSTSVGLAFLGDALAVVPVEKADKKYDEVVQMIINKMFEIADKRSLAHKSAFKEELDKTNPLLSALYARMSKEVIHLQKKVRELEAQLKKR